MTAIDRYEDGVDIFGDEAPAGAERAQTTEQQYAAIVLKIRAHEDEIDALKATKAVLEAHIMEAWTEAACSQMRVDGHTLFLKETTFATTPEGKDAAIEALRATGYGELVKPTVNSNTLSALVREKVRDGEALPAEWAGVIGWGSKFEVGVRK